MVLIEDKANGSAIISTLRSGDNGNCACRAVREQGIKGVCDSTVCNGRECEPCQKMHRGLKIT